MDEIVKYVSEKTGLSKEQARQATEAVLDYLEKNLPEPFGEQVKNFADGGGFSAGDIAKGLGGLFGKK